MMTFTAFEETLMASLLEMAASRRRLTNPNPMVAAAVYDGETLIATGVHQKAGEAHAEVLALEKAGPAAKGAQVMVTLEPCTHYGKTPPCAARLIEAGVRSVVYAMTDPNPKVRAQGAEAMLTAAGIEVRYGLMAKEAAELNHVFMTNILKRRPHVLLKAGISQDGALASGPGVRTQLTGEAAMKHVHAFRRDVDAILIGIGTALIDDPMLTVRHGYLTPAYKPPVRVVLDTFGQLSKESRLVKSAKEAPLWVYQGQGLGKPLASDGVITAEVPHLNGLLDCKAVLENLFSKGICSVMIEGGDGVYRQFLSENLVDSALIFMADSQFPGKDVPRLFHGNGIQDLADALCLTNIRSSPIGEDRVIQAEILRGATCQ